MFTGRPVLVSRTHICRCSFHLSNRRWANTEAASDGISQRRGNNRSSSSHHHDGGSFSQDPWGGHDGNGLVDGDSESGG